MEPERLARAPLAPSPLIAHPSPLAPRPPQRRRGSPRTKRCSPSSRSSRARSRTRPTPPPARRCSPCSRSRTSRRRSSARGSTTASWSSSSTRWPSASDRRPRPPPQTTAPDHTQPHRCDWALTSAHGSAPGRHPKPNPNHRTPSPRPSPCPDQARCKACLNARAAYEKAAKGPLAERADFYEVDQSVGRLLCTLAKVAPLPVLVARAHRAPRPAPRLTPSHPRLCRSSSCRWRTSTRAASSWTRAHCTSRPSSGSSSRASRSTRTDTARSNHVEKRERIDRERACSRGGVVMSETVYSQTLRRQRESEERVLISGQ